MYICSVRKTSTPLIGGVAIDEVTYAFTTEAAWLTGKEVVVDRLIGACASIMEGSKILLEIAISAKTPFGHLKPNVATIDRLKDFNPEILESLGS